MSISKYMEHIPIPIQNNEIEAHRVVDLLIYEKSTCSHWKITYIFRLAKF